MVSDCVALVKYFVQQVWGALNACAHDEEDCTSVVFLK